MLIGIKVMPAVCTRKGRKRRVETEVRVQTKKKKALLVRLGIVGGER